MRFSKNIYLFLGKVENVHLEVPVHWKDLTLAKELEGFSYPSMALQSYSTSPSTCWRGTWTSKPPTAHVTLKSTLSRRSAWHCWRRRSKRRRAPLIMGFNVEVGLLCIGRFDFKGLKGSKGQPGPGRGRNTHLRPLNNEHHL